MYSCLYYDKTTYNHSKIWNGVYQTLKTFNNVLSSLTCGGGTVMGAGTGIGGTGTGKALGMGDTGSVCEVSAPPF
jgi:hypothetical protein